MKEFKIKRIAIGFALMAFLVVSFLRIWYIGRFFDDVLFSFPFGLAKFLAYAIGVYISFQLLIGFENIFKKKTVKIALPFLIIGLSGLMAASTTDTWAVPGFEHSVNKFLTGWGDYSDKFKGTVWVSSNIHGGLIGNFSNGLLAYATNTVSLIIFICIVSVGASLVFLGGFWELHRIALRRAHAFTKKINWRKMRPEKLKENIKNLVSNEEDVSEYSITPLKDESDENVVAAHSTISQGHKDAFIEIDEVQEEMKAEVHTEQVVQDDERLAGVMKEDTVEIEIESIQTRSVMEETVIHVAPINSDMMVEDHEHEEEIESAFNKEHTQVMQRPEFDMVEDISDDVEELEEMEHAEEVMDHEVVEDHDHDEEILSAFNKEHTQEVELVEEVEFEVEENISENEIDVEDHDHDEEMLSAFNKEKTQEVHIQPSTKDEVMSAFDDAFEEEDSEDDDHDPELVDAFNK